MSRVALVTGASGPFGSALCRLLLTRGYVVVGVYRSRLPAVDSQLSRLMPVEGVFVDRDPAERPPDRETPAAFVIRADLADRAAAARVVELCLARHDRVDVLINAAADVQFHGPLTETVARDGAESHQLAVNTIAPVLLTSELFLRLWKHDRPANYALNRCVINVSSISALVVSQPQGQGFYAASKAALNILTLYQASELADYCVRVNGICPARWSTPAQMDRVLHSVLELAEGDETGKLW